MATTEAAVAPPPPSGAATTEGSAAEEKQESSNETSATRSVATRLDSTQMDTSQPLCPSPAPESSPADAPPPINPSPSSSAMKKKKERAELHHSSTPASHHHYHHAIPSPLQPQLAASYASPQSMVGGGASALDYSYHQHLYHRSPSSHQASPAPFLALHSPAPSPAAPAPPMRWADYPQDSTPLFASGPTSFSPIPQQVPNQWGSHYSQALIPPPSHLSCSSLHNSISPMQQHHHYSPSGPPPPVRAPTRVLFLRNLPVDISEKSIAEIFDRFGSLTNCLLIPTKQAAFLEFEDLSAAQACFYHYRGTPCEIHGRPVEVLYSGRDKIVKKVTTDDKVPTHILLVTISRIEFPVTVDVLREIFSKYGDISKIVIFSRGSEEQAFVQFDSIDAAQSARKGLEGRNIYSGCNHLKITFSHLKDLTIKQQDTRNWEKGQEGENEDALQQGGNDKNGSPGEENSVTETSPRREEKAAEGPPATSAPDQPGAARLGSPSPSSNATSTKQPRDPSETQRLEDEISVKRLGLSAVSSSSAEKSPPPPSRDATDLTTSQISAPHLGTAPAATASAQLQCSPAPPPAVVLVKNLDEESTDAAELAALFAVYGDVLRAKIMFSKRNTALVQMATVEQCHLAISNLQLVPLHGRRLALELSRGGEIPPIGKGKTKLAADFDDANYARHKNRALPIFPPSQAVHVSNLPDNCQESEVLEAVKPYGRPEQFKFLGENHRMAILTYPTLEAAVKALVGIHAKDFKGRQMRCAFARHPSTTSSSAVASS